MELPGSTWQRLGGDNVLTADQFKKFKEKVDIEVKKRCLNDMDQSNSIDFGSLRPITADMNFTNPVQKGALIKKEHGDKTINFLYEIKDIASVDYVVANGLLPTQEKYLDLETFLNTLSRESMQGDSSSCRGACTGLCFGSCIGGCNGCSDACTGDCSGCTATCGTGCANSSMYA